MNVDGWVKSTDQYIYMSVCNVTKLLKHNKRSRKRFLTLERQSVTQNKLLDT